ncbi:putative molibdopterin-dependent oxidoreductase YjgC [Streptomyces sp. SLBN-8D4]
MKVTAPLDGPVTKGSLCSKGRFGYQHVQTEPGLRHIWDESRNDAR